jgi:hypothetical protein
MLMNPNNCRVAHYQHLSLMYWISFARPQLWPHLMNLLCTLAQLPGSFGNAHQGAPFLAIHITALINPRLSQPERPLSPALPGKLSLTLSHWSMFRIPWVAWFHCATY